MPMVLTDTPLGASRGSGESIALAEQLARGSSDPEQIREAARIFALEGHRERAIDVLRQGILTHSRHAALLASRSEEHTSELQSRQYLVCRLLLEKKKKKNCTRLTSKKKKKK